MSDASDNKLNKLPETPSGFLGQLFNALPSPLNWIVALCLLGFAAYVGYHYLMPKKQQTDMIYKTVVGLLIGKNSKKPLTNVSVGEEHNPLIKDETIVEGTYILEKIIVPDNKIISLVVSYPDGTMESIKDIDVAQLKSDKENRLIIPNKEVKDWIPSKSNVDRKKSNNTQKNNTKNYFESKDQSKQNNMPDNKGTIRINQ